MKRDWNLLRDILLQVESVSESTSDDLIELNSNYTEDDVRGYMELLNDGNFIKCDEISSFTGSSFIDIKLTNEGCDVFNTVIDSTTWSKIIKFIKTQSKDLTLHAFKSTITTLN